jgi:hypothetical protein
MNPNEPPEGVSFEGQVRGRRGHRRPLQPVSYMGNRFSEKRPRRASWSAPQHLCCYGGADGYDLPPSRDDGQAGDAGVSASAGEGLRLLGALSLLSPANARVSARLENVGEGLLGLILGPT